MAGQHGSRTRYNSGCRCDECRQASRDYDKLRRLAKAADVKPSQVVTRLPVAAAQSTDSAGRVESGVLAEIGSLSNADSRVGLVEIAIALARVLDSPLAIAQHPSAAHRLSETLDKLRKGSEGRTGRLASVRQMTSRNQARKLSG